MRDLLSWNVPICQIRGVKIKLHAFFVAFALPVALGAPSLASALWPIGLLFASVLAHELGHCFGAYSAGGRAEHVVLWPFGGLAQVNVSPDPQSEFRTVLWGPLVSLFLASASGAILLIAQQTPLPINPLMPPSNPESWTPYDGLRWAFWMNFGLVAINLLPAFPLDGARLLRSLIWSKAGYRTAVAYVAGVAQIVAIAIWALALALKASEDASLDHCVLPLMLFGVLLFFNARQEAQRAQELENEERGLGFEFPLGLENKPAAPRRRRGAGLIQQWLAERRQKRLLRQREVEESDDRRLDEVLARMHELGSDALSEEDRALLVRISARYRSRQRG
jgi:Zn-dependent protease